MVALLATATMIAATIGLAARLGTTRGDIDRGPGSSSAQPKLSQPTAR